MVLIQFCQPNKKTHLQLIWQMRLPKLCLQYLMGAKKTLKNDLCIFILLQERSASHWKAGNACEWLSARTTITAKGGMPDNFIRRFRWRSRLTDSAGNLSVMQDWQRSADMKNGGLGLYLMVIPDLKIGGEESAGNQVSAHKISNFVLTGEITNRIFVQNLENINRNFGSLFFDNRVFME